MRNADNENEPFPFQTLAAITARVLTTDAKENEEGRADRDSSDDDEKRREQHRAYVEQRLRELAAFERRARGNQKSR